MLLDCWDFCQQERGEILESILQSTWKRTADPRIRLPVTTLGFNYITACHTCGFPTIIWSAENLSASRIAAILTCHVNAMVLGLDLICIFSFNLLTHKLSSLLLLVCICTWNNWMRSLYASACRVHDVFLDLYCDTRKDISFAQPHWLLSPSHLFYLEKYCGSCLKLLLLLFLLIVVAAAVTLVFSLVTFVF